MGDIDALRERAMPHANGHFPPGQLWHITHRCHENAFLLKFARDQRLHDGFRNQK
jgi:hypothetical protein